MSVNMTTARRVSNNEISPVSETTPDSSPGPSPKRHCIQAQGPPPYSAIDAAAAIGGLAARACEKCRASKRKCDKKLPFCDRCKRLNAKCQYVHDISSTVSPHGTQFVIYQPRPLTHDPLLRAPEPLDGISAAQLLALVSTGACPGHPQVDWRAAVTNYFFCVHPWFAVVHPAVFERQIAGLVAAVDSPPSVTGETPSSIPNSRSNSTSTTHRDSVTGSNLNAALACQHTTTTMEWPSKTVALLVLAMYLNTRMRLTDVGEQPIFDETYRTVKRLLSPLLVACVGDPRPSVELVQAGALLALYEYGHGEIVAAYRTLSQTVVTARVMDIKPGQIADTAGDDVLMLSVDEELTGCLWWAMFILEQSIHQDEDAKDLPFLLETPTRNTLLPETPPMTPPPDGCNFPLSPPTTTTTTTTSSSTLSSTRHLSTSVLVSREKFGGFQLSAKTATLFHRAIRIDKERAERPGKMPLVAAYADLDREIRETTLTLLNDTLDWEGALDCFAMLSNQELSTALAAIRFACKMSTDISCKINADYGAQPKSPAQLCAPAGATCYMVILAFASLGKIFPEERAECQKDIAEKFESLTLFSFRWGIAG
ncbi:uncharacterized protein GGS22DRAFT_134144 [Annulohypoxylon maeteangense]|uniref:uncharacterized protein n=1 Tax=Annulohypoxylon maeteangense TaxID=1927788 RepID=UPI0020075EAA|nr:uncharacterized protein GGS22DRAFT_134144 [Annulohypoxylon maeteangense]KAI0885756.1 hypothetical protein GGS22DRAFT_134144 [Annulohypoxylon maeteangense]